MKLHTYKSALVALGLLGLLFGGAAQAAPTVALTKPTANAAFAAPGSVAMTATATPSTGTTIAKVAFYQGMTLLGTDTTAPYGFTWSNAPVGSYSLTAKATDSTGAVATSTAVAVVVENAPTVSLTAPTANAVFAAPASITLNATAADTDGTISKVDFYQGSTLLGTDTTAPYSFTWSSAPAGSYSLTAKATDNKGVAKTSAAVAIVVDAVPTVSLTAPAANTVFAPPATITLNATAADTDGTISKVEFYRGTTLIGTSTTAPYSVTWSNAPLGSYSLTAKATDNKGVAKTSAAVAIAVGVAPTVSLTAPAANTVFAPSASITLSANAADTDGTISKVEFYRGSTLIGTATTAPYSVVWSNAALGSYSLTAKATDNHGIAKTSAAVPIAVGVAPTVSLTSPTANAVFTAPASITLSANAADTDGTIGKVEFYQGSTLIGTATTAPYSVTWNSAPAGSYSLTAKATDNNGITKTSAAVAIVVDAAPTVSLTAPTANAVFTAPASITLSATAADTDGTISKVEFYQGSTLIATATTAPYSVAWSNAPAGSYSLTAKATDNKGVAKTSAAVAIVVDAAPTVSLTAPTANAVFTAPANITLSANAADTDGTISKVEFYQGTTLIGTSTTAPYSVTWSSAPAGSYSLTAKATDNKGVAKTSAAVAIVVDAAPTVSLTAPTANAVFTAPANITLSANAADTDGTISKVEFYQGTTLIGTATTAPYSVTWSSAPAGSYSLTAKATDNKGVAKTSAAVAIIVDAAPTVSLTAPAANAVFKAPASITLSATAADTDGTISKVEFYQGSTLIGTATTAPYSVTWSNAPAGSYSLTAKATDNKGVAKTSAAVAVTVSPNQAPTVSITTPTAAQRFAAPATVTVTANAGDGDGTLNRVEFYQGSTLLGTATSAPYSVVWGNVTEGSYSLTAKAVDNGGAVTVSAAVAITVETGVPVFYLHNDHLNTPRLVTDRLNRTVWRNQSLNEPFGNSPPEEDPDGDGQSFTMNLRFPGQYFDKETNLSYNYYRDYDSSTGRYVQSDPIGLLGGINTYGYVEGNPLLLVDPEGLASCTYSISSHTMTCTSNGGGGSLTLGPVGLFSGVPGQCRNNPECTNNKDEGPIPLGNYKMNQDDREGNEGFWRLEPDPAIPGWKCRLGQSRCGFMLHPGTVSLGCITADPENPRTMRQYNRIDRLLQREDGANTLTVTP